jgi:ABC-2 type transport system permease protein
VSFSQGVIFRGTSFEAVWLEFAAVVALGLTFLLISLALFRRSISIKH